MEKVVEVIEMKTFTLNKKNLLRLYRVQNVIPRLDDFKDKGLKITISREFFFNI